MAYNSAIPQPSNKLRNSQGDLLGNFQAIETLIDVNHVDFSDSTNQGKHNFVTLPVTTSSPSAPTFLSTEEGLYNLLYSTSNNNEIYAHIQQSLVGTRPQEIPFTASVLSRKAFTNVESSGSGTEGWTYLPSGILLQWHHVTSPAGGGLDSNIPTTRTNFPAFNVLLAVIPTVYAASSSYYNTSVKFAGINSGTVTYNLYFGNGAGTANADGVATVLLIGY